MTDIVQAHYPLIFNEYALDGSPDSTFFGTTVTAQMGPIRQNIERGECNSGGTGVALPGGSSGGKMIVVPVVCFPGDVFNYVTIGVVTANTGATPHAFAAVYGPPSQATSLATAAWGGMNTTAPLLAQSTDTGALLTSAAAARFKLASTISVSGQPGTQQGTTAWTGGGPQGPIVLGVAIMTAQGTAAPLLDGALGASPATIGGLIAANAAVGYPGQVPLELIAGSSLTTTAPATLTGATSTGTGFVPYVVLSEY